MRLARWLVVAMMVGGMGCDGDGTEPTSFEAIVGSYTGDISAATDGPGPSFTLVGNFGLTLTQSDGTLSGSYSVTGDVDDGVTVQAIQGSGPLTGTVAKGPNPSVSFTITPGLCPNHPVAFFGTYDSDDHRLTITGPVQVLNGACNATMTFQTTVVLTRNPT